MAEKIIEKLDNLNEYAKIILDRRIKKNSLQGFIKKKTSVAPLTFDFQLESEEAIIAKSTSMTVSKNTENKSHEPVEEYLKSRSHRPFLFLKDIDEVEYTKPLRYLYSQHRPECGTTLGPTTSSVPSTQSNTYKKEEDAILFSAQTERNPKESFDLVGHLEDYVNKRKKSPPPMNDFHIKGNKSVRNDQLSEFRSVGKKSLLPLCIEDELKKPNAKIINISPAKTVTPPMEQNDTNPIIFHETEYVQMLLLTTNRPPSHPMDNRNICPHKKANFVLEKNRKLLRSLINDKCITSSKPKSTTPIAWRKGIQAITFEVSHRVVEDKLKKKTTTQTFKNTSWNKLQNFSEPFSSLTKKFVGVLGKTVTQEMSAKTGKFERLLSTVTPMSKFSASPVKYCSKPLKNVLQVHTLYNVTPLDDLLKFSHEN
ncbi:uncharacterized protein C1orf141 homolog [Glossophaga mutica]